MDVRLVADDHPVASLPVMPAAVLNSGVVIALESEFALENEVRDLAVPDQKLVVLQMVRSVRFTGDAAVLDGPERLVTFPASQVLAVKETDEAVFFWFRGRFLFVFGLKERG